MNMEKPRPRNARGLIQEFLTDESGSGKPISGKAMVKGAQILALTSALGAGIKHFNHSDEHPTQSVEQSALDEKNQLDQMIRDIANPPIVSFDERHFSNDELKCLTDNVYHEARGESVEGKYAVVFATLGRVLDKRYPKSICGVVHQPWQFSWTKDQKILAQPINPRDYLKISIQVHDLMKDRDTSSAAIEAGFRSGLPHGALFYKKMNFTGSEAVENFFSKLQHVGTIGAHGFFIEKKAAVAQRKDSLREK